jgi:branched-subunit amino acid aminotransferase/4-amino-4-deoxychorismate lyase
MLVTQVCAERGIPVRLQAPLLSDMDSWQGAFISSTSRLLLPVCEIAYQEGHGQLQHKVGSARCLCKSSSQWTALGMSAFER